jgi:hypothetical protein
MKSIRVRVNEAVIQGQCSLLRPNGGFSCWHVIYAKRAQLLNIKLTDHVIATITSDIKKTHQNTQVPHKM